ncbi:hypothetical protein SARC_03151 [Sphaeroforma arctica JP610]|uniref:AAA+ ATPase domain-containing protein n=1 Tax=Sphaeroforma arctica JP610 TaxID=667725 RepID=A0A0L0G6Y1_9EUKA|nr:hypothetical protein SARC_03151 [Sphaeroforma arctica JP610]KNC84621.1 hypothetical protein SARC_03151 [Sphaeroforma arctica JP610]|eukprot:XP_014158523.1 hypothetical protein SARC_03151 [Sphaeroforma arctica JP610]
MRIKYGYYSPSDQHNLVLQKALLLYVTKNCDLSFSGGRFKLVEKPSDKPQGHNPYEKNYDSSELSQLKAFEIITEPPLNVPVDIGNGVTINMRNKANDEGEGGEKDKGSQVLKTTITFTVSCEGGDGKQKVDAFVVTAFEWQTLARYMYVMRGSSGNSIDDDGKMYKRYELSEDKTFDAMFFRQEAALLRLLSHFKNRMGKYAIRSYPKRLTLLLHGSPGTGKTSLIKALAQHSQRHIISIPLARITTNQELMDVMFDQCYTIKQDDLPMKLKFKQVVFVIEDIDCASKIGFARNSKTDESGSTKSNIDETVSTLSDLISSNGPKTKRESMFTSGNDALNLAGLLNVLDGIVDCVDRIVIMTTNHPENLDPALIRPGRVNLNIDLGFIRDIESFEMIEHFFACTLSEKEKSVISRALATAVRTFTPAEMEQLCCEYDTVEK